MLKKENLDDVEELPLLEYEIGQETEDDIKIDYLDKLSEAVTWSSDWTVESIVLQITRGTIELDPDFQRRNAWSITKKSRFIESLIYGLPIPQIVLAEHKLKRGTFIVVDGKQRLLTLQQFCKSDPSDIDILKLSGLKNIKLNGLTYQDLQTKHSNLYNHFINQPIRSVVIKNWPSESFLYTIFYRLNTGSLSLSSQELRRALKPGPFLKYVDEFSINNNYLAQILNISQPDYRMRDVELAIRFFSFAIRIEDYKGDYKTYLDETCDLLNKHWKKYESKIIDLSNTFNECIKTINKIFIGKTIFRRWKKGKFETRLNRAVFDVIMYYCIDDKIRNKMTTESSKIVHAFKDLCESNPKFIKSVSSNTNNLIETSSRFVIWGETLHKVLRIPVKIPINLKRHYDVK